MGSNCSQENYISNKLWCCNLSHFKLRVSNAMEVLTTDYAEPSLPALYTKMNIT